GGRVGHGGGAPPLWGTTTQLGVTQQPGDALAGVPPPLVVEFGVHPWSTAGAARLLMDFGDSGAQRDVLPAAGRWAVAAVVIVGGPGDLHQPARPGDVAVPLVLRLDERVHVHRDSLAKKAVARLRMSTSCCRRRLSRR